MFLFISLLSKFQLLHLRFDPLYMVRDRVCFLSSEYGYSVSQQQFLKTLPFLQFTHWLCFFYKSFRLAGVGSRCRRCHVAHTSPISESLGSSPGRTLIPAFGSCTPWQEAGAGLSTWASATHVGGLDFAPGFCFSLAYLRQASGGRNSRREIDTVLSVPLSLSQVKLNFKSSWPKTKQKRQLAVPLGFMSGFHPFHVAVSDFTPVPGYFGGILQLCCSFSAIPTHLWFSKWSLFCQGGIHSMAQTRGTVQGCSYRSWRKV